MKSISPDIVLKPVKEYILMAVGMLMYSFGWIGCLLPAGGVGGGGRIAFHQSATEDVLGDEHPVVTGVARQKLRLTADRQRIVPHLSRQKEFRGEKQDVAHRLRNRHVVPPPVGIEGTVGTPPVDCISDRTSQRCISIKRVAF